MSDLCYYYIIFYIFIKFIKYSELIRCFLKHFRNSKKGTQKVIGNILIARKSKSDDNCLIVN